MRYFCLASIVLCLLFSCTRSVEKDSAERDSVEAEVSFSARPLAVLQAGEYPLWFQLYAEGPVLLNTIEEACFSAALIPWPLAPHIPYLLAQGDELLMASNRDGFYRFAPWNGSQLSGAGGIGLYHISGGEFWRQYTVGAFIFYEESPAALLYLDDRFLDSDAALPDPRFWTFDAYSTGLQSLNIPALDIFPPDEGWNADTLRFGRDGFWYYRLVKKSGPQPEIRMFRSAALAQSGENVSLGAFQNSALPEPLGAAPAVLRELLAATFAMAGGGTAVAVSPDFQRQRYFAGSDGETQLAAFYRSGADDTGRRSVALAILPDGRGLYLTAVLVAPQLFTLPALPAGFVYTGIGLSGDTLCAAWEEQDEFSIGAAGFMVIRLTFF
jgi:hypothetical protein